MGISHQHNFPCDLLYDQPVHKQGPEWLYVTGLSVVYSSSSCKEQDVHVSIDGKIARVGLPSNHSHIASTLGAVHVAYVNTQLPAKWV